MKLNKHSESCPLPAPTNLRGNATTKQVSSNLICLKSKSRKTAKQSLENLIWEKVYKSGKSRFSFSKLKRDLYQVKICKNTKF